MDNNDKSASQKSSGFLSTLPGVLTGVAGVIGAVTALILGLKEAGLISQNPTSSPSPTSPPSPTSSMNAPPHSLYRLHP